MRPQWIALQHWICLVGSTFTGCGGPNMERMQTDVAARPTVDENVTYYRRCVSPNELPTIAKLGTPIEKTLLPFMVTPFQPSSQFCNVANVCVYSNYSKSRIVVDIQISNADSEVCFLEIVDDWNPGYSYSSFGFGLGIATGFHGSPERSGRIAKAVRKCGVPLVASITTWRNDWLINGDMLHFSFHSYLWHVQDLVVWSAEPNRRSLYYREEYLAEPHAVCGLKVEISSAILHESIGTDVESEVR